MRAAFEPHISEAAEQQSIVEGLLGIVSSSSLAGAESARLFHDTEQAVP